MKKKFSLINYYTKPPDPDPPAGAAAVRPLTQTRAVGRWQNKKGKREREEGWPVVLGIVKPPEDDVWSYKDYRNDRVWQRLAKIAEKRGIKIVVSKFEFCGDTTLGFCSISEWIIVNNEEVPNWYKPFVLAHELAHFKLHGDMDHERYINDPYYRGDIEQEAEIFKQRLYSFTLNRLPKPELPPGYKSIDTAEGWNEMVRKREEEARAKAA